MGRAHGKGGRKTSTATCTLTPVKPRQTATFEPTTPRHMHIGCAQLLDKDGHVKQEYLGKPLQIESIEEVANAVKGADGVKLRALAEAWADQLERSGEDLEALFGGGQSSKKLDEKLKLTAGGAVSASSGGEDVEVDEDGDEYPDGVSSSSSSSSSSSNALVETDKTGRTIEDPAHPYTVYSPPIELIGDLTESKWEDPIWLVNGIPYSEYFRELIQRRDVCAPFMVTSTVGKFHFECLVHGGGLTGKSQAVRMSIANALQKYDPTLRPPLKTALLLRRDQRKVERKKFGRYKARKSFQWVKR
jgi:ribosomal protein S9